MPLSITKPCCIAAVAFGFSTAPALATEAALKDSVPHLTVTGTAKVEVAPDMALLSLGVETERPQAGDALDEDARATQAVVEDIKAQGIDARDIKTTAVALVAVYDTISDAVGRATTKKLRGYSARNTIEVRIRQIDKAGLLARQWVSRGANQLVGLRFVVEHPEPIYEKLRGEAVEDALRRATAYLAPTGAKLGRIIEINGIGEGQGNMIYPAAPRAFDGEEAKSAAIPIEAGAQNLSSSVQLTWELMQ